MNPYISAKHQYQHEHEHEQQHRKIRGRSARDELDGNIYDGELEENSEEKMGRNSRSNKSKGRKSKKEKEMTLDLEHENQEDAMLDAPNRQRKRFSISEERRVSINRLDAALGLDPTLLDPPESTLLDPPESPPPPAHRSKSAPRDRPSILDRMISDDALASPPPASAFSKVKTTVRGLSAFKTITSTTPAAFLQPQQPDSVPTMIETAGERRRRKSSRRKSTDVTSSKAPEVLPLTEGNLIRAGLKGEDLGPLPRKTPKPTPQHDGPLVQKRSRPRAKSLGKQRRRRPSTRGGQGESLKKESKSRVSNKTKPTDSDAMQLNDSNSSRQSPSLYKFVQLRVIAQVECPKPYLPEEDSPVTASFLKVMKTQSPTWGALAKELSQGMHSVEMPILSFSHPTNPDETIQFGCSSGGQRRAILMSSGHERQMGRMRDALISSMHFAKSSITELLDPTKAQILDVFRRVSQSMRSFDSLLIYFVGHDLEASALQPITNSDPRILIPADHGVAGFVNESDFWEQLVKPIQRHVEVTCILDCHLPANAFDLNHKLEEAAAPLARPGMLQRSSSSRSQHQDERDMINALGGMLEFAADLAETDPIARPHLQYNRDRRASRANALATLLNAKPHYGAHASLQLITTTSVEGRDQPGETTAAFVQVLTDLDAHKITTESLLFHMRMHISPNRIPQIKSPRPIDFHSPFSLYENKGTGTRRALLVGINYPDFPYTGSPNPELAGTAAAELEGSHVDLQCFKLFLHQTHGYLERDLLVLMDDSKNESPTRSNIVAALRTLVTLSEPGDSVVFYFVGEGSSVAQRERIHPSDFAEVGVISGDNIWQELVEPMSEGVRITCLIDAPTTKGNVIELPYSFEADDEQAKVFIPATVHVVGSTSGRITKPFLQAMMPANHSRWLSAMDKMQDLLTDSASPDGKAVLSSSRKLHQQSAIEMMPQEGYGAKRALLIGITYGSQPRLELQHSHEALGMFKMFLQRCHGLTANDMTVLQDRGLEKRPTRRNIVQAIHEIVEKTQPGDSLFLYYCGHGNAMLEKAFGSHGLAVGEKWEAAFVPSDIDDTGRNAIVDDELLNILVRPLPEGSTLTCVTDCFNSDSAINLPYSYRPPTKPKQARSTSPFRRVSIGNSLFPSSEPSKKGGGSLSNIISGAWSSLKDETHDYSSSRTHDYSSSSLDFSDGRSSAMNGWLGD